MRCLVLVAALLLCGCPSGSNPSAQAVQTQPGEPPAHDVDPGDLRLKEAVAEARATVQTFVDAVKSQDGRGKAFKARFEAEDGTSEHMWVRDARFEDGQLVGLLDNEPTVVKNVKPGDEVRRDPSEVSDWMLVGEGNKVTGGYTIRAIRAGMTDADRKEFDAYSDFTFD